MRLFRRYQRLPEQEQHDHEVLRKRAERLGGEHVEDYVYGANDGIITTFAVVSGATGGALGSLVIIILGFANLFADAVSMGASNYLAKRSRSNYICSQREMEEWAVDHEPEEEREEIRRIYSDKGFEGEQLDALVHTITQNKSAWVDLMMTEELGLTEGSNSAANHAFSTFAAFVVAGILPLIPYLFCMGGRCFLYSSIAAAIALFVTGALRTLITGINWLRGGLEMLAVGSAAGAIAYGIGYLIAGLA